MKSKNILCLNHAGGIGGASLALSDMLEPLIAGGCKVWILTPSGPVANRFSTQGATTVSWEPPALYWLGRSTFSSGMLRVSVGYLLDIVRTPWRIVNAAKNIATLIRAQQIDTIYVNTMVLFPLGFVLSRFRRKYHTKVVWHVRELLNPELPRWVYRWIVNAISGAADVVLSVSGATSLPFAAKCTPIWDGNRVGREWMANCGTHSSVSRKGRGNIVMATSFLPGKGISDFLRLAKEIHKDYPGVTFSLYTSHPVLLTRVERWLAAGLVRWGESSRMIVDLWNCRSTLIIDGFLTVFFDHRLVPADMAGVSMLVNPDVSGVTWGRVVIEAMCAGVPVVSYGSDQEYVVDGVTGYLVRPGDFDSLLKRVRKLLANPAQAREMGKCAQARIAQIYQTTGTVMTQAFGTASRESTALSHSAATHEKQDDGGTT